MRWRLASDALNEKFTSCDNVTKPTKLLAKEYQKHLCYKSYQECLPDRIDQKCQKYQKHLCDESCQKCLKCMSDRSYQKCLRDRGCQKCLLNRNYQK